MIELRLARASNIQAANRVLERFLPRFNRRFGVPPRTRSLPIGPWTPSCVWNKSCASSTSEEWPGATR